MQFCPRPMLGLMFAAALSLHAQTAPTRDDNSIRNAPIKITADLTDAPRKLIHAQMTIPVTPGPLTLLYAKWIPGEHMPDGPIDNLAGLFITANGQQLQWTRDDVNMYAIRVTVPQGVTQLEVKDDFLATAGATGFSAGASTSANLAMLSWNELVLYPAGHPNDADIYVQPSVVLPQGWAYGTALTKTGGDASHVDFGAVSLEQLIDSPLLTWPVFCGDSACAGGNAEAFSGYCCGRTGGSETLARHDQRVQQSGAGDGSAVSVAALRELSLFGDGERSGGALWAGASSVERRSRAGEDVCRRQSICCCRPICCRMSSRTRGTGSIGGRRGWRQGTTKTR
jgi:hypothetical protein